MIIPGFIFDSTANFVRPPAKGYGLRLYGATSGSVGLKPAATAGSTDFTLPSADGSPNQFMKTNGSGVLSFATVTVPVAADPTSTVSLTTIVGTASTFMRSDGAPALSQAIVPTWTGQHTFASGTITTSAPITLTQTWNSSGVTFVGFTQNITNTASASGSLLFDWQFGGNSVFSLSKNGTATLQMMTANAFMSVTGPTPTGAAYMSIVSAGGSGSGGSVYYGLEATGGGQILSGSSSKAAVFGTGSAFATEFGTNNIIRMSISSNGNITFTQGVSTSGSPTAFTVTSAAHTTLTASTEATDINFNLARTVQFATGALTTQRAFLIQAPTYSFVSASTITTAATIDITGSPTAGTNATITNSYALRVESGNVIFGSSAPLFWDNTNTFLGVNSTTRVASSERVHIECSGADGWIGMNRNGNGLIGIEFFNNSSGPYAKVYHDTSTTDMVVSQEYSSGSLKLRTNSTDRLVIAAGGNVTITQGVQNATSPTAFTVIGAAHTTLTASTESIGANFNFSATKQFSTGAITTQREVVIQGPTYAFVGNSTITNATTVDINSAPVAGTNATITNKYFLTCGGAASPKFALDSTGNLYIPTGSGFYFYDAGTPSIPRASFTNSGTSTSLSCSTYYSGSMTINGGYALTLTCLTGQSILLDGSVAQKIVLTGNPTVVQPVQTSGSPTAFTVTGGAHTTLTASTESIGANFNFSATKQFATGALTTQREVVIQAPTYGFVGASTITTAATLAISGAPIAGTNATLTNSYALWIQGGKTQHDTTNIGSTSTDSIVINNSTAASAGAQQWSGRLRLTGQGWKTATTAASQACDWIIENQPVQASANPYPALVMSSQVNGGGFNPNFTIQSNVATNGTYCKIQDASSANAVVFRLLNANSATNGSSFELFNTTTYVYNYQNGAMYFGTNATSRWGIQAAGHLVPGEGAGNNTYDIGNGTYTVRSVYIGTTLFLNQVAVTSGSPTALSITGGAHTTLTASTESIGANFNFSATKQFATGALTTQREVVIQAPTYGFVGASTITTAATFTITGAPIAGTNATLTNSYALWIQGGKNRFENTNSTFTFCNNSPVSTNNGAAFLNMTAPNESNGTANYLTIGDQNNQLFRIRSGHQNYEAFANDITLFGPSSSCYLGMSNTDGVGYATYVLAGTGCPTLTCGGSTGALAITTTPIVSITQSAASSGSPTAFTITSAAHTTLTTTVEDIGANFNFSATKQWATGAVTTQREMVVQAPTYGFVDASTITKAATVAITGAPIAGTNATITNSYALWIQSGLAQFDGTVALATPLPVTSGGSGSSTGGFATTMAILSGVWS